MVTILMASDSAIGNSRNILWHLPVQANLVLLLLNGSAHQGSNIPNGVILTPPRKELS